MTNTNPTWAGEGALATGPGIGPTKRQGQLCREELDLLCHALSHDLRAPLRSIDGFSRMLFDSLGEKLDEQSTGYFHRVIDASHQMACLLDDLLQLTRVTRHQLHKEALDVSDLAGRIVAGLRQADPERNVHVTIMPGLSATGDRLLLELAFEHLFDNAWKFTRPRETGEISFGVNQTESGPVFYLYDNGIGFDMGYYRRLFGVFERLHNLQDFPGYGIGLATVKRILQRHNGRIWASAVPDLGACFWFNIPTQEPYETTVHSHDRGQRERRNARKNRAAADLAAV
jgi:light-regulated signal transduction histidine kinase (bacteriophytochrome)